jgi:tRNA nucleotidyltransferase (CCA-adding enzyme)
MNIQFPDAELATAVARVNKTVTAANGRAFLVGGCVRDAILGLPLKDVDIEVYGLTPDKLIALLSPHFRMDLVGQAFGVIKLQGLAIDVSIPRRESKAGLGHKGFEILSDPDMKPEDAAARRDFTINAMAYEIASGMLVDPYAGARDLDARLLRHVSANFVDDPLRVLRGMQFASRFKLTPAPETVALCRTIGMEGLARERIFDEWKKLILRGVKPSLGLHFLNDTEWIKHFPELNALVGCAQEPEWHPEGDVWTHTLQCMDAFADARTGDEWEDVIVGLAVLCHDLGKPATTAFSDGRIRSLGHEEAGDAPTRSFLARMTNQDDLVESVVPLVAHHLKPQELYRAKAGDSAIRRLARKVKRIDRLVRIAKADQMGRFPMVCGDFPEGDWLLASARRLDVQDSVPKPLVLGRHLIQLGLTPGPIFGRILDECYEAQLDGAFNNSEDGVAYATKVITKQRQE